MGGVRQSKLSPEAKGSAAEHVATALICARTVAFLKFLQLCRDQGVAPTPAAWLNAQLDGVSAASARLLEKLVCLSPTEIASYAATVQKHTASTMAEYGFTDPMIVLFDEAHQWLMPAFGTYPAKRTEGQTRAFLSRALSCATDRFPGWPSFSTGA